MNPIAKAILPLTAIGLTASCATSDMARAEKGEMELAELLEGRVAGEPENCINTFGNRNLTMIDQTAVTYRAGDTIWVARATDPRSIDEDDILLIEKFGGSQLCTTDQIKTVDRTGGFLTGFIRLESFVPYRLPEDS